MGTNLHSTMLQLRRLTSQLEFDKLGLETLLDRTRNELDVCEKHNFQLTDSLTTQRVANAELSTEVEYLRRMRDRNKATAGAELSEFSMGNGENAY
jgi:DNA repair ATPase RecN